MRVIRHGREDLEIEVSGLEYYLWGSFGSGEISSVFLVVDIYKIAEGYPISTEDLRVPGLLYIPRLIEIDEEEKRRVRETVCAEWKKDDLSSHFDISFYDEEGMLLCTNADRMNVLTIADVCLEIHMDGAIARLEGEKRADTFVAKATSMMWLRPDERKATAEEIVACVARLERYYETLPRGSRPRIVFADDKGKKRRSIG